MRLFSHEENEIEIVETESHVKEDVDVHEKQQEVERVIRQMGLGF